MDISDMFSSIQSFMPNTMQNTQNMQKQTEDAFSVSDVDGNGTLSEEEFEDFNKIMQEAMGGSVALPGMEGMSDSSDLFSLFDEDESGELSLEEVTPKEPPQGQGGSTEQDDLLEELMAQMQQTLMNMVNSSNNTEDEDDNSVVSSLVNSSNIQEYLNQANNGAKYSASAASETPSVSVVA